MSGETVYTIDLTYTEIDDICIALFECSHDDAFPRDDLLALYDKLHKQRNVKNVKAVQS